MSKKSRYRRPFVKYHGRRAETVLKSELQHLYHIYWSLWRKISWKKSLSVIWKILGLFVNPLTADDKFSLLNSANLLQHSSDAIILEKNLFLTFFLNFRNLHLILSIF